MDNNLQYIRPLTIPIPYRHNIVNIIKNAIIKNQIPENQVLNEQVYADKLKVSRTPVREAFNLLHENGWIVKSGKNYVVSPIRGRDIEEIFTLRIHNEKLALILSFPKFKEEDFLKLDSILSNMQNYSERVFMLNNKEDILSYLDFDKRFHLYFSLLSGNKRLYKMLLNLTEHFLRFGLISFKEKNRIKESFTGHQELLQLIKNEDLEQAIFVLEKNINRGKEMIKRQYPI